MSTRHSDAASALATVADSLTVTLDGVSVSVAGGAWDAAEVRRHIADAPALVLACLRLDDYTRRGNDAWRARADLAAYVITRDMPAGADRHSQALTLSGRLMEVVSGTNWGRPQAFDIPELASVRAHNLYSGSLDSVAVALWAVTWRQALHFSGGSHA